MIVSGLEIFDDEPEAGVGEAEATADAEPPQRPAHWQVQVQACKNNREAIISWLDSGGLRVLKDWALQWAEWKLKEQGGDVGACGFAWVGIHSFAGKRVTKATKVGKALLRHGVEPNHERIFTIWNPSGVACQSVAVLRLGAAIFAEALNEMGFEAYAFSRLD